MGNKRGPFALLASLVTASALGLATALAQAQTINVPNVNGQHGELVPVAVTISVPASVTAGVAGTQNDITFDPVNAPINTLLVCVNDPTVSCTTDQECVTATGVADDKCGVPDCTANAVIKKEATAFGFLPPGCSGAACTGVRALVFGIKASTANKPIPDGSVLYTCNVAISATALDGTYPLTISGFVMSFPSPPGGQIPGTTGVSGSVIVGVPGPTNTPGGPTNTPGVPTNTPGGPTNTPGGPTNTPGGPTNTPGGPTNTPVAQALAINVPNVNGQHGELVPVAVTISVPASVTAGVAGTQNDITFDPVNAPINTLLVCVNDPTVSCTTDQECVTATGVADDKCGVPDCTANDAIKKEATAFGFLPPGCSGTACTGVRALVFGIKASSANKPIPDGSVLYTCNVAISATAADGTYPLTISNVVMSFPSPPGGQIPGATGVSGSVIVGVPPPTNTPGGPTNTPGGPTNTPGGVLPTSTATATATAVVTATKTPGGPTNTPGGPTNTPVPSGALDEDGCQISTVGGSASWLLLIPAVGLLVVRRRHR